MHTRAPETLQTLPVSYFALRNDQNSNSDFVLNHQAHVELQRFSKSVFAHVKGMSGRDECDAQEAPYSALVCHFINLKKKGKLWFLRCRESPQEGDTLTCTVEAPHAAAAHQRPRAIETNTSVPEFLSALVGPAGL